ncbi:MAG: hypothetical protein PHH44_01805 [bacterium]|nr:hypothetical protein [bacterium]
MIWRIKPVLFVFISALLLAKLSFADELIDNAWKAMQEEKYENANKIAQDCLTKFMNKAKEQQGTYRQKALKKQQRKQTNARIALLGDQQNVLTEEDMPKNLIEDQVVSLGSDELNSAGTACFIQGEVLKKAGKKDEARKKYKEIVDNYKDAYCYDPRGWYWKVSDVAQDRIDVMDTKYDYSDYTSETLTGKGWKSLKDKDFKGVELYAKKCIYLYEQKADEMQTNTKGFVKDKKDAPYKWALNDVATCYFIMGEKYLLEGKDDLSKQMYKRAAELGFSLCWDPQGWYWKVGEVAQDKIDLYGTKYSFGDYKSVTLTSNAWQALADKDYKGVDLYCKKCIYLYEDKAKEMQAQITEFPKGSFVPYYWALNDVATCYFIMAESYKQQNMVSQAKQYLMTISDQFSFAQCWDKRGWYWQIAKASQKSLEEMQKQNP